MTSLADAFGRLAPGRTPEGIAAALLPYTAGGAIDWPAFERHLDSIRAAGLGAAVNMDTGFGDLLTPEERDAVLDAARRTLGPGARLFAGAFAGEGDPLTGYRRSFEAIAKRGATPVIVQCPAMGALSPGQKADLYGRVAASAEAGALAFELSPRFAPHGEIWDDETFERVLEVPGLHGSKHSSLDRETELRRLAARDRLRPDFRIYTGNDLAIDLVAYGSDYLLGLACFAPSCFAARDAALGRGEMDFLALNDGLQHLGNVAFREPVPAYKHSAALFLHLIGELDGDAIHPRAPRRPQTDRVLLFDCALRLGLIEDPERARRERLDPLL